MSPARPAESPPLLGQLLVEGGLITARQLNNALAHQQRAGCRLGEALAILGFIKSQELEPFLAQQRRKVRLGELLVQQGVISRETLAAALREQTLTGRKLGEVLVQQGVIQEQGLMELLARHLDLPFVCVQQHTFPSHAARLLPSHHAKRLSALILEDAGQDVLVGLADPMDLFAYDELVRLIGRPVRVALIAASALASAMDRLYRPAQALAGDVEALALEVNTTQGVSEPADASPSAGDAPVSRLLHNLFEEAVLAGASDIHIEPDDGVLRIRQRVDGVLQERLISEWRIARPLVSKLKLMAGLEITEHRLPQDGRFRLNVRQRAIDVRLATLPIQDGESVVLRLLDQSASHLQLEGTGLSTEVITRLRRLVRQPHGLLLVTGPTGSGKTTTLYGLLSEINDPGRKIITVEDPVEYRLPRVSQVQVKPKLQLGFAQILRHILRQDPDVILVGEMRDRETAEVAVRAALTGHLVLSTLHTRDAQGAITRLLDLGVAGYAVASSLLGVLSQRLVRRLCPECAVIASRGCTTCHHTGYRGRLAVAELLTMTPGLADALRREDLVTFTRLAGQNHVSLHQAAMACVRNGQTTMAEAERLAPEFEAFWQDDDRAANVTPLFQA